MGEAQYWRKFIANFSFIYSPLHDLTSVNKVFQWEGKEKKSFDTLEEKKSMAPVLALPNLQKPFEIETDASGYAMGPVLMQHKKPIHASYVEQYTKDEYFKEVYESLRYGYQNEELNYHINNKFLYHLGKICIPQSERVHVIREAHTSLILEHFGVGEIVAQL